MPRKTDKSRVKVWQNRVDASSKEYKKWEEKFRCKELYDYYEGFQWPDDERERYVINLVFPTIEARKPSLLFYRPKVKVEPLPTHADDMGTVVEERAQLTQDTVNTFIQYKNTNFQDQTYMALLESFFRFGMIEVGYTADFIDNPNAGKPLLEDDGKTEIEGTIQPEQIPKEENLFIKRIPAHTFRVSMESQNDLGRNSWCGYYEWHYPADLKRNKQYKNTNTIKITGQVRSETAAIEDEESEEEGAAGRYKNMAKVWKIWDNRTKKKMVWVDGGDKFLVEKTYRRLPFADLKFHERLDQYLPLPVVFNWKSPQDELNETREMQRTHRKRFYRRYTYVDGAIDIEEIEKLETGGDGVYAKSNRDEPLRPVPDAPLDSAILRNIPLTKDDFREISGVGGDQRNVAESETATQAQIMDVRSRVRESWARVQVANWLARIARLMIEEIRDNFTLPMMIRINVDPLAPSAGEQALKTAVLWQQIQSEELVSSYDVSVDIESLSPMSEDAKRQQWTQLLTIFSSPQLLAALSVSDVIMRKTLGYYGITSEREIQGFKQAIQQLLMMQIAMAQAQSGGGGGGPVGQEPAQPGAKPDVAAIMKQIENQLPTGNVGGA